MPENLTFWNIPRWDDASAYPRKEEEWSDDQWLWEFLRRTDDYRWHWLKYENLNQQEHPWLGLNYELAHLIPPATSASQLGKHIFESLGGSLINADSHTPSRLLESSYELVVINPNKNLDKQWGRAKTLIRQKHDPADKPKRFKNRQRGTNNLILLLRTLDGYAQDASPQEIGKLLFHSTAARAEKELNKANELWLAWLDGLPF